MLGSPDVCAEILLICQEIQYLLVGTYNYFSIISEIKNTSSGVITGNIHVCVQIVWSC